MPVCLDEDLEVDKLALLEVQQMISITNLKIKVLPIQIDILV